MLHEKFQRYSGGLLKSESRARQGVPSTENMHCILNEEHPHVYQSSFIPMWNPHATKNAKKVEHKGVPQP